MPVLTEEEIKEPADVPGFYLVPIPSGFVVHMNASARHLSRVRDLAARALATAGVDAATVESAQLVASELIGNAVRACGDWVPLVIEIAADRAGVRVLVHDPDRDGVPRCGAVAMDDDEAEFGRGPLIVDCLAPGWRVATTPGGKQIRCRLRRQ